MTLQNTQQIHKLLQALGEKMDFHQTCPVGLVVCGGAAMNVIGVLRRPTKDIDVVALGQERENSIELKEADLPKEIRECAWEIADDFGLTKGWLNTGPRELFKKGLPEGIEKRLKEEQFGSRLCLYWLGREDLICLKLYAAASRSGRQQQHIQDLDMLRPNGSELEKALDWTLKQDDSEEFKEALRRLLCDMGHNDLAYGW